MTVRAKLTAMLLVSKRFSTEGWKLQALKILLLRCQRYHCQAPEGMVIWQTAYLETTAYLGHTTFLAG